jgi:hypothetical protein
MTDHAKTFVDHAIAFGARNPNLNDTQSALGGLMIGALRALLECDCAPGIFRLPVMPKPDGEPGVWVVEPPFGEMRYLYCKNCGRFWEQIEPEPEKTAKRNKANIQRK